ncbi:MAG: GAF domain-containing protein, partial [Planctomycetota bacterium]
MTETTSLEEQVSHLADQLKESQDNTAVVLRTTQSLEVARTPEEGALGALSCVCECFGWTFGSYWVPGEDGRLRLSAQSGAIDRELDRMLAHQEFAPGVGIIGRVFRERDLAITMDLTKVDDVRGPASLRAGLDASIAFPIVVKERVAGVVEFLVEKLPETLSDERIDSLQSVGMLLSLCFSRLKNLRQASRLQAAISGASTALMLCNTEYEIVYTNPAVQELFRRNETALRNVCPGGAGDGLIGQSVDVFFSDPAQERRTFAMLDGRPIVRTLEIADRIFEINVTSIVDGHGDWMGNCLEWKDLTEQRHAEEEVANLIQSAVAGNLDQRIEFSGLDGFMQGLAEGINQLMDAITDPIRQSAELVRSLARGRLVETLD